MRTRMRTPPGDAAPLLVESTRWNPPARFGVYEIGDPAIEDETLIDLWVDEGLPHPRVPGPWDRPAARAWLTAWINATSDISDFAMVPRTSTPVPPCWPASLHYAPTHPSCKASPPPPPPRTHTFKPRVTLLLLAPHLDAPSALRAYFRFTHSSPVQHRQRT